MIILAPTTVNAQIDHNALIFAPLLLFCSSLTLIWAIFSLTSELVIVLVSVNICATFWMHMNSNLQVDENPD